MMNSKPRFYSSAHVGADALVWAAGSSPDGVAWGQSDSPMGKPLMNFFRFPGNLGDRYRTCRLLMRMIAGAPQRPRLDVPETKPQCFLFHLAKLGRRVEARNRQVIF